MVEKVPWVHELLLDDCVNIRQIMLDCFSQRDGSQLTSLHIITDLDYQKLEFRWHEYNPCLTLAMKPPATFEHGLKEDRIAMEALLRGAE